MNERQAMKDESQKQEKAYNAQATIPEQIPDEETEDNEETEEEGPLIDIALQVLSHAAK